jgi:hypothetical protein
MMEGCKLYAHTIYKKQHVFHGPYDTHADAERAVWYLTNVQRHKLVAIEELDDNPNTNLSYRTILLGK